MSAGRIEHPSHLTLSRFADGDLSAEYLPEVTRHLEECDECRADVQFIRRLGATARSLEMASPPDVVEHVIRRRRAGERGHLSGRATGAMRGAVLPDQFAGAVAAAGLALAVVTSIYLLLAPTAAATRGELRFGPLPEATGAEAGSAAAHGVPVTYSPAYYLSDEDSLRLRARVSRSGGAKGSPGGARTEELRVVTLYRADNGTYRGRLPREQGDLFAVAAIEDFDAVDLDTNFGRLWDIYLEREPDGQPTMAALESQYRALESYNWVLAGEWAEGLSEEFPGNPLGWAVRYWHLVRTQADGVPDSVRTLHRQKLLELTHGARASADAAEIFWLSRYAASLGDQPTRDSLFAELERRDPDHPAVVDRRVADVIAGTESADSRLLRLERLWETAPRPTKLLVLLGLQNAAAAGDDDAVDTWLTRGSERADIPIGDLISSIAPFEELAGKHAELLRRQLADIEATIGKGRPLRESSIERKASVRDTVVRLKVALAGALAGAGDSAAAQTIFDDVAEHLWRPEELVPHVDFLLSRGDTTAALPSLGLLLVDPLADLDLGSTYKDVLQTQIIDVPAFLEESRSELARRLAEAFPRDHRLTEVIPLAPRSDPSTQEDEFLEEGPTVLFLWDGSLTDELGRLAEFERLAGRASVAEGIKTALLLVPYKAAVKGPSIGVPVLIDANHALLAAIRVFAVPAYVVVDSDRHVLRHVDDAATAFRIAKVLSW